MKPTKAFIFFVYILLGKAIKREKYSFFVFFLIRNFFILSPTASLGNKYLQCLCANLVIQRKDVLIFKGYPVKYQSVKVK